MDTRDPRTLIREYPVDQGAVPGDPKYDRLRDSIHRDGIEQPIDITSRGLILDGHHRHAIALEIGLDSVPVRVRETPAWPDGWPDGWEGPR